MVNFTNKKVPPLFDSQTPQPAAVCFFDLLKNEGEAGEAASRERCVLVMWMLSIEARDPPHRT